MDIKRARDITRQFIREGEKVSPTYSSAWYFVDNFDDVCLSSEESEESYFFSKRKLSNFLLNSAVNLNNGKIKGGYYLTAVGLISEDEYLLAKDIIERYSTRIPKKELDVGSCYISEKGESFLYIGSFKTELVKVENNIMYKEYKETDHCVYNLNEERVIKLSSVKLIDYDRENNNEDILYKNLDEYLSYNNFYQINIDERSKYVSASLMPSEYIKEKRVLFDNTINFPTQVLEIIKFINSSDIKKELKVEKIKMKKWW